jgi:DNA-binding PadR family transcriptional regulator
MISAPKGVLRLAALKLLAESSLSGVDLSGQIERISAGQWMPGPGSVYLVLGDLLKKGLITELPKRGGNVRRYVISGKGKDELSKLAKEAEEDVERQLRLLALYSGLTGRSNLQRKLLALASQVGE